MSDHPTDHITRYAAFMDRRADADPKEAVGGLWEEIGLWQLDLMRGFGLEPQHHLLDLGCGSFRGGRHFIRFLKPLHYTGIDISPRIIETGCELLASEGIAADDFMVHVINSTDLSFLPRQFDFVLAQSVFTHSPLTVCDELLRNIAGTLTERGRFVFTFFEGSEAYDASRENYYYPREVLSRAAAKHGLEMSFPAATPHPRGQTVVLCEKVITAAV